MGWTKVTVSYDHPPAPTPKPSQCFLRNPRLAPSSLPARPLPCHPVSSGGLSSGLAWDKRALLPGPMGVDPPTPSSCQPRTGCAPVSEQMPGIVLPHCQQAGREPCPGGALPSSPREGHTCTFSLTVGSQSPPVACHLTHGRATGCSPIGQMQEVRPRPQGLLTAPGSPAQSHSFLLGCSISLPNPAEPKKG